MRVAEEKLKEAIVGLLRSMEAKDQEAELVADVLVQADMRGIHTHGCAYVPIIAQRKSAGLITIPTHIKCLVDDAAVTLVDGNNGLGQVAAVEAMQISIAKARKYGVAMTLIRNTNNIGFLGYYSLLAAAEGMIGICMTNAAPAIAPWGGAQAIFGTNPVSIAAPLANGPAIVLDMSSSVVARGKIRRAQRLGEKIPDGWALDAAGIPTTDPGKALEGTVLPIAGPKGYGMALFVDLLSGLLSGSKYGRDVLTFHKPLGPTGVGVTQLAIDISRFMPRDYFENLASEYARAIRKSDKARGTDRIFLPGEIEAEKADLSKSHGVQVDNQIVDKLNQLLAETGSSIRIGDRDRG